MKKVIHLASVGAGIPVHSSARPRSTSPIERQQAIENALSMALHFVRQPGDSAANLWAATARTNRALTLLKQANEGMGLASLAGAQHSFVSRNAMGRA